MRNGFNQLGRALSTAVIVLLLIAPVSQGATFLLDRDGNSGRGIGPINRIIHALKTAQKWIGSAIADDMIIPRP
jgi:hypothetical protein